MTIGIRCHKTDTQPELDWLGSSGRLAPKRAIARWKTLKKTKTWTSTIRMENLFLALLIERVAHMELEFTTSKPETLTPPHVSHLQRWPALFSVTLADGWCITI